MSPEEIVRLLTPDDLVGLQGQLVTDMLLFGVDFGIRKER